MNILFCAAECAPFAKVGGLGDVVGSLPKALTALGESVRVCIPYYGYIAEEGYSVSDTGYAFSIVADREVYPFKVLETVLPQSTVPVYFLDNPALFRTTDEIYPKDRDEFSAKRLDIFGQAVFELIRSLDFKPDILHLHDWHTARLAQWLKTELKEDSYFQHTKTVLSIHNMAYQGISEDINRLKAGLETSDAIVAVSPTYAREILTPEDGCGLEDVLRSRLESLSGILNGIDTELFSPLNDKFIPVQYDRDSYDTGKSAAKESVQIALDLPNNSTVPMFGMVTRLVEQKGLDLLLAILPELSQLPAQFVLLGSGETDYEDALKQANKQTSNVRSIIGHHVALGQQIYAGSDVFMMPSRFEPCGLGQLIAFRYGSIPLVRKTGGLADTVVDSANGFVFEPYTAEAFLTAIQRAIATWQNDLKTWEQLVVAGMTADFSWQKSALAYQKLYRELVTS